MRKKSLKARFDDLVNAWERLEDERKTQESIEIMDQVADFYFKRLLPYINQRGLHRAYDGTVTPLEDLPSKRLARYLEYRVNRAAAEKFQMSHRKKIKEIIPAAAITPGLMDDPHFNNVLRVLQSRGALNELDVYSYGVAREIFLRHMGYDPLTGEVE